MMNMCGGLRTECALNSNEWTPDCENYKQKCTIL